MGESNGNGRDTRGWFAKGNAIAAGNPINVRMREFRTRLLNSATEADIQEIYTGLLESARAGDTGAAKVLLEYLCGKPTQSLELSGPGGAPLSLGVVLAAIREHVDAATQLKLAATFQRLAVQEGSADGGGGRDAD
jgi:hypothetical protein